jgi:hypothetical protein
MSEEAQSKLAGLYCIPTCSTVQALPYWPLQALGKLRPNQNPNPSSPVGGNAAGCLLPCRILLRYAAVHNFNDSSFHAVCTDTDQWRRWSSVGGAGQHVPCSPQTMPPTPLHTACRPAGTMRAGTVAIAALLAFGCLAAAAAASPLSRPGRRLLQLATTFQVDWDLAYGALMWHSELAHSRSVQSVPGWELSVAPARLRASRGADRSPVDPSPARVRAPYFDARSALPPPDCPLRRHGHLPLERRHGADRCGAGQQFGGTGPG